jgi:hypothetical protein
MLCLPVRLTDSMALFLDGGNVEPVPCRERVGWPV